MGSDLRLTGLASGMDWQPIVDKLLNLKLSQKQDLRAKKLKMKLKSLTLAY